MGLRFVIGRAGSGKSHVCMEEIIEKLRNGQEETPIILLVPEQATFQYEYLLATTPGLKGIIRAQVISFRRLAWRVLQETGGSARAHIGDLGKRMLLKRILEQKKAELKIFNRAAKQPGFAESLASILSEFKMYQITTEELKKSQSSMTEAQRKNELAEKLEDLSLIYSEFETFLAGRFTDPDDYLNLLAEKLVGAPSVQGADIYIDGFTGFTPQEFSVIEKLLVTARRVSITLCFDPVLLAGECDQTNVFYPTLETYDRLRQIADNIKVEIEPTLSLDLEVPVRFKSPGIAHLEKNFFQHPTLPSQLITGVKLSACANRRAEVEAVAREIISLCRDKGLRWRDAFVILRNLDNYDHLLSTVFQDYGIPFFIDQKRNVLHHPLVELIRSAFEVVIQEWAYDPVFRYLKTDLIPVEREKLDKLENYVLTHGIRGSRWVDKSDWNYRKKYTLGEQEQEDHRVIAELAEINNTRYTGVAQLSNFYKKLGHTTTVREITTALFELLVELRIDKQLEEWSAEADKLGKLAEAKEHLQLWNNIILLLDEIVETLGEEKLPIEEYAKVLDAGLEGLRLGAIPPGLDQVVVGTLERSRNPNVRVTLVLGANDGVLPARPVEDGVLSDVEREHLREIGLKVAPGARRRLFDEQYLVYTALTRASELLWISYPLADDEGKALVASHIVPRIKELLPGMTEELFPVEPPFQGKDLDFIAGKDRSLSYLAAMLRELKAGHEVDPLWLDVYTWFVQQPDLTQRCKGILSGLFHINQEPPLTYDTGRRLYNRTLRASVSRLEKFSRCPFSHYLSHGLKLRERGLFKLAAPDLGQFFHAALKLFADRTKEKSLDWADINNQQVSTLTHEIVDDLAPQLQNEILLSTARHRYLVRKLKRIIERAAHTLTLHARRGTFRPVAVEVGFGNDQALPAIQYDLGGGCEMEMTGRIDRVDSACEGGQQYLRVIDYKSGEADLKLAEIIHGLKLQLLTYLDVALRNSEKLIEQPALPAGVLYFGIKDALVTSPGPLEPETAAKALLKQLKLRGLLLADPLVVNLMDNQIKGYSELLPVALNKQKEFYNSSVITLEQFEELRKYLTCRLKELGRQIVDGQIAINPYKRGKEKACTYCVYRPVCQFDPILEDNLFRLLLDPDEAAIWSIIKEYTGGNSGE